MAKGEQGRRLDSLIVSIADVEAFAVDDLEVLAGPVVEGRRVFEPSWECALRRSKAISQSVSPHSLRQGQRELTGSFPLGLVSPNSTSANALPASWP